MTTQDQNIDVRAAYEAARERAIQNPTTEKSPRTVEEFDEWFKKLHVGTQATLLRHAVDSAHRRRVNAQRDARKALRKWRKQ